MYPRLLGFLALFALALALPTSAQAEIRPKTFSQRPKLVLVVVIDQFRADYLTRFRERFIPAQGKAGEVGGFRYLMEQGAYFPFAQYDVLQSVTGPGHAMILSGAYPYQMGIAINVWYDHATREPMYCVGDKTRAVVGSEAKLGMSPRNLVGDTLGDSLKGAGYPARVVSVSLKDRAAILMGGHGADLALWFDPKAHAWVSSEHYLPGKELPEWVKTLNRDLAQRKGQVFSWEREGRSPSFKHSLKIGEKDALASPFGLELNIDAAKRAFDAFKLGTGTSTDIFAVSLSSHDYAGHQYGPNSGEQEEMTVAEDRLLSNLLNHVRKGVQGGLREVVVVLVADHGVASAPEHAKAGKLDAGTIDTDALSAKITARLEAKYGKPEKGKWVVYVSDLNFYLNQEVIAAKRLAPETVEAEAKAELVAAQGVAHVFTRSEYFARRLPPLMHERQIVKTFFPGRSGDVVIIPKPFYFEEGDPAGHMTGYSYDRTVPLILAGSRFRPGVYSSRADVIDLAPTLAFVLGVIPPALSEGRVLSEALAE